MGTIISVYSRESYKEYILPADENVDHKIVLTSRDFGVEENFVLRLENTFGKWYLRPSDQYKVLGDPDDNAKVPLEHDTSVGIESSNGEEFILFPHGISPIDQAFRKLGITGSNVISIGREKDNDICYDGHGLVSRHHVLMKKSQGAWEIENRGKNGFYVNSRKVEDKADLEYGDLIDILGLHILFLGDHIAVGAPAGEVQIAGSLPEYQQSDIAPGSSREINEEKTSVSELQEKTETEAIIDTSEVVIEQPVTEVSRWKDNYLDYLSKEEKVIQERLENYSAALETLYPPADEWTNHRAASDPGAPDRGSDELRVRLGKGDIPCPFDIRLDTGKLYLTDKALYQKALDLLEKYKTLKDVPVTFHLRGVNEVDVESEKEEMISLCGSIAVQLAGRISPDRLKMAFISEEDDPDSDGWRSARWLPHVWSEDMSFRFFASEKEEADDVIYRISRVLLSREGLSEKALLDLPRYIVFISDHRIIEGTLLERYGREAGHFGVTIVTGQTEKLRVPGPNTVKIRIIGEEGALNDLGSGNTKLFRRDDFDGSGLDDFARRLAAVRDSLSDGAQIIPDHVSARDVIGSEHESTGEILERWAKNRTYEHLKGVIGQGIGGAVKELDLHERYCGPHSLIVGTTGAGKSELLRSYILSLAMEYSPDDLIFILIDFKGGGMANALADLPHVSGCITNLSGSEINRAILAIKSEIVDRQKLLNRYGISHVDDYIRLYKNGDVEKSIPHIMIIIDEFAELKRERPELLREFISIAQIGRSLGIHLILSTQKARGNVDDDIRSNVHSVICLRVQDRNDSMDVLDRPDAAYITNPGRGYLKVGAGEMFEPFQAAFSGEPESGQGHSILMLTDTGKTDVVSTFTGSDYRSGATQLEVIKARIKEASAKAGSSKEKLWLDPLDKHIMLSDMDSAEVSDGAVKIPVGMIDDPENRKQYPLELEYPEFGNTAIAGMPSSGKSAFVKTIVRSLSSCDPGGVMVYVMGFDSSYEGIDESSGVIVRACHGHDVMNAEMVAEEISDLIKARKTRGSGAAPCLVIIDSFEDYRSILGYQGETRLAEMLREGPGASVYFIITGGGFGLGQISGSVERNIKTVLSLRQKNRFEYIDTLRSTEITVLPEGDIKGRGVMLSHGGTVEFQIADPEE